MGTYRHLVRAESDAPPVQTTTQTGCSAGVYTFRVDGHGYTTGDQLLFSGFPGSPSLNTIHTITVIDSDRFSIVFDCAYASSGNGNVQLFDLSSYTEVYPLGYNESSFSYTKDNDKVYFKRIFTGVLSFSNRPADGVADYDFFLNIETTDECEKIDYLIQKECDDVFTNYWTAFFAVSDGEFDKDKCIFKITPITNDNIDCMEQDVKENILDGTDAVTTYYKAGSTAERNYTNTRTLKDVLEFLVSSTCSTIDGVVSNFFQINPETISTLNYVTGEVNPYDAITIGMKKDILEPIPSDLQTDGTTSFHELMVVLNTLFNVFYTVVNNYVRIEHISYFESQAGLDLTQASYDKWTRNTNKYSYDKSAVPSIESFTYTDVNAVSKITYSGYCANNKNQIKSYSTGNFSTNIYYLRALPDRIKSTDGFVIMATTYNGSTGKYEVIGSQGDEMFPWKLILKFFRHNRSQFDAVFTSGSSNFGDFFIYSVKKTKKQKEFVIPLCCGDDFVDSDYMTTALGKGHLSNAEFNIKSDTLKVNLLYGPDPYAEIVPSDISGLQFWVKGDDANPAGAISSWTDQSGNGRHATQATGSKQPVKVLDVANGNPIIRFDGTDDGMATSAFQTFPSKRGTVFVVWKNYQPINTLNDHIVGTYGSGSGNMWDVATQYLDTGYTLKAKNIWSYAEAKLMAGGEIASDVVDVGLTYPVGTYGYSGFVLLCYRRIADAFMQVSTNGLGESTIAIANTQQDSNPLNIGNSFIAGNSNPLKGDIAEIIIYDSAISTIQKQRLERYLIRKYALFAYS